MTTYDVPSAWKVLAPGAEGRPLVLAVDLAVPGRPEPTFSSLAPRLDPGVPLWECRRPRAEWEDRPDGRTFTEFWAEGVRVTGRPVAAVLGHRVGGLYAAQLARLVAWQQGHEPRVVLFDPEPPSRLGMTADFRTAVARLSSVLTSREEELAERTAQEAALDDGPLPELGAALAKSFTEIAYSAFAAAGLPAAPAGELAEAYGGFVTYVAAASVFEPAKLWGDAVAVTSPAADAHAGLAGRRIEVAAAHEDILRSALTAQVLTGLLA